MYGVHLGGEFRPGRGVERALIDPATGQITHRMVQASTVDVDHAVEAARSAQPQWADVTAGERARVLLRLADLMEDDAAELTRLEVTETGKPVSVFRDGELPFAADNLRFFAGSARSLEGTGAGELSTGYTSMLLRRPLGVVAGIAPWNFPLVMAIWKLGPALAAGNAMVLKPAPATPSTTLRLAELAGEAGFPAGVLNVVTGETDIGHALTQDPRIAMVSITGSSGAGRAVMRTAAETTKRVHLELGGKAPALVFDDADLDAATAAITMAATYNSGQDCTAATRAYVHRDVFDDFVELAAQRMEQIVVGDPQNSATDIGPLVSAEHRDRVHGFVTRAFHDGATLRCGGVVPEGPGAYYPPTLLINAEQSSEIVQQEIFGPVLTVLPFAEEREAVELANDCDYGLASSVWTADISRALRTCHRIEAGVTWVNDHLPIASEAPHGGVKASGFGKDMSHEAVLEYTVTQHVMVKHAMRDANDSFRPA